MSAPRRALVTGAAGFIGFWISRLLIERGFTVVGVDAMTDYYDVRLKEARARQLAALPGYTGHVGRVEDMAFLDRVWREAKPDVVIHLAAQAGVRHSIDAPRDYVTANLEGSFNLLECARHAGCGHLLMASTSSVYGANTQMPYRETDKADTPMSFYAATKKANEAMAHSYAHLFDIPVTMFRFFTVYGPWGRPDMALFKFTRAIMDGAPIDVYNHGRMRRDFTYVGDLVEAIARLVDVVPARPANGAVPEGDSLSPVAPFRVVNIGNAAPVELNDFIAAIEAAVGKPAQRVMLPIQPGDVPATWADTALLQRLTGFVPSTPIGDGVAAFVDWFRDYDAMT